MLLCASGLHTRAVAEPGAAIFQEKCAICHGADGQGDPAAYDEPLFGDLSIDELTDVIERTMPDGEPETCVGEEARAVAAYIYKEFYSLEARLAKGLAAAPRVEIVRLTVEQHRNALADLVGRFTPEVPADEPPRRGGRRRGRRRQEGNQQPARPPAFSIPTEPQPGLRSEYYQSNGMNKADEIWDMRVDRRIDFDYDQFSPAEGITADQFTIIWQGSVLAPATGHYEFRIRTENGARLYLNNDPPENRRGLRDDSDVAGQSAFIDAWVGSGDLREVTGRTFLLGGRHYPIRLEFFKYLEPSASIRLEWKPPHGTWSVLDQRFLTTARAPRTFVVDVPFPADDRSLGYERGSAISREWQDAATAAAVATAAEVINRLPLLSGIDDGQAEDNEDEENDDEQADAAAKREQGLQDFIVRFASVAYRRPLSSDEEQFLREVPFADAPDPESAVRRAIVFILTSPHFLYADLTPEGEAPSQHVVASRLSLALWDSLPDAELIGAADNGELAGREKIEAEARRMLADPRARAKLMGFFRQWLEFEERDLTKDEKLYPAFDESVAADLRYSLEVFLDSVLWSESSDYRELLLADYLVLNDRLQHLYDVASQVATYAGDAGAEEVGDDAAEPVFDDASDFDRVAFPPDRRAGVLTHPFLLSAYSYHNNSSPIHRGVFLTRNIVGRPLKPPPVAVAFKEDEFAPDLTMREKITQLTRDKACMSCHSVINPLGFALENYDAVGRWRTSENDKPIDTAGQYVTVEGRTLDVASARDVANFAATSPSAHRAFVTQLFRQMIKQNPAAYGADSIESLRLQFADDDFNMQHLVVSIAVRAATHGHP
jgi:hypothetical protein